MADDFDEHGKSAIRRCREEDPSAYVRALIALQPKDVEVTSSLTSQLSDAQLDEAIALITSLLEERGPEEVLAPQPH